MDPHDAVRHRPLAFDKMEALVREMQDPEAGVPVRSQKIFLTSVPSAFMGYDLIEWLMERLGIEESVEALNLGNQLCQYGYFFPVSDSKNLVVKDDSSLYRFQSPYYWPWQQRGGSGGGGAGGAAGGASGGGGGAPSSPLAPPHPDNVEYAVYLCKRTKRNRQRHSLEEYEAEALAGLRRNLQAKWDFITMQANEQVKLAKERKKGDKIVSDSQERAYWRVYRPPPGVPSALEPCPIPGRCRNGPRSRRRELEHCRKELDFLRNCLSRTRVKVSVALDSMVQHAETFAEYDPLICPAQPSNPWVSEDITYWQLNSQIVEVPTEKRVRRWALSMEELVSDPTGLQEFTAYLRKEYSHENIRFWMAANDLRRSAQSHIQRKVNDIYEEFLAAGAPCEINIDGKTMERVQQELKSPSRFTFDAAADHVYALLLKKDCYPRFVRSEHYKTLIANGKPMHKKRFFGFGGPAKKKSSTTVPPTASLLQQAAAGGAGGAGAGGAPPLGRRRGSDRSLSGSAHELAVSGVRDVHQKVPHSHSQSNLSDIPYRVEVSGVTPAAAVDEVGAVCPWDVPAAPSERLEPTPRSRNNSAIDSCSSSSDISVAIVEVSERLRRSCGLPQQSTLDGERRAPPPVRRLSAFEPRRGPTSAASLRDDFPHRSFDSSTATSSFARDNKDNSDTGDSADEASQSKSAKKAPSLLKSFSVCSAATMVAPVISVSSVADDLPAEESPRSSSLLEDVQLPEEVTESPSTTVGISSLSLTPSPLSPSAPVPVAAPTPAPPPLLEVDERSEDGTKDDTEEVSSATDEPEFLEEALSPPLITVVSAPPVPATAPLAESEDAAEDEDDEADEPFVLQPTASVSAPLPTSTPVPVPASTLPQVPDGASTPTPTSSSTTTVVRPVSKVSSDGRPIPEKDEKGNDICPWEDEETCKVDTPFVKTYATLGYL